MSFLDTMRKNLTPELFTQVVDQLGDDFDFDLVPRTRLNKVIKQRNQLRDQLLEGSQPSNSKTKGSSEDDDDDDFKMPGGSGKSEVDVEALRAQWLKEQGDAVTAVKIQFAALEKLRAANAIDPELIWQSGLIDTTKLKLTDSGTVEGIDDAITQLQKDRKHLFTVKKDDDGVPGGTGKTGGDDDFKGVTTKEEFLKLDADKQLAFKAANPETFKSFMNN